MFSALFYLFIIFAQLKKRNKNAKQQKNCC